MPKKKRARAMWRRNRESNRAAAPPIAIAFRLRRSLSSLIRYSCIGIIRPSH